jgi:hypothetical protein
MVIRMVIRMVIQTIELHPTGPDQIDAASHVSRDDPTPPDVSAESLRLVIERSSVRIRPRAPRNRRPEPYLSSVVRPVVRSGRCWSSLLDDHWVWINRPTDRGAGATSWGRGRGSVAQSGCRWRSRYAPPIPRLDTAGQVVDAVRGDHRPTRVTQSAPQTPSQAARRQGPWLSALPQGAAPAPDHCADRPARGGVQSTAGPTSSPGCCIWCAP